YSRTTDSISFSGTSDPKTTLMKAFGSPFGVFTFHSGLCHSVLDHQKTFCRSPRCPCIFVKLEPLRAKNTLGFQRAISAAHSYSGLPQWAPRTVIFGERRAISSR